MTDTDRADLLEILACYRQRLKADFFSSLPIPYHEQRLYERALEIGEILKEEGA